MSVNLVWVTNSCSLNAHLVSSMVCGKIDNEIIKEETLPSGDIEEVSKPLFFVAITMENRERFTFHFEKVEDRDCFEDEIRRRIEQSTVRLTHFDRKKIYSTSYSG